LQAAYSSPISPYYVKFELCRKKTLPTTSFFFPFIPFTLREEQPLAPFVCKQFAIVTPPAFLLPIGCTSKFPKEAGLFFQPHRHPLVIPKRSPRGVCSSHFDHLRSALPAFPVIDLPLEKLNLLPLLIMSPHPQRIISFQPAGFRKLIPASNTHPSHFVIEFVCRPPCIHALPHLVSGRI